MEVKQKLILLSSVILFVGGIVLLLLYIACTGVPACAAAPDLSGSPAWAAVMVMGASVVGCLFTARNPKAMYEAAFLILVLLGFAATVACTILTGVAANRAGSGSGLWFAMMVSAIVLSVVELLTSGLLFWDVRKRIALTKKVAQQTEAQGRQHIYQTSIGGNQQDPRIHQSLTTESSYSQPGLSASEEHTYSQSITASAAPAKGEDTEYESVR